MTNTTHTRTGSTGWRRRAVTTIAASLLVAAVPGAGSASAAGNGPSFCKDVAPGRLISEVARTVGHSDLFNPGNAKNDTEPALKEWCNPN